ncbi:MAG: hypothetical protein PHX49_09780 [Bacteroidales bacterium]|jgi:flagellar biosynthesis GTPase FlhF|nr:hypothetical protein [Bacteroidales bacterium]
MTKVTDEMNEANNTSSIFKSNKRLKQFFTLIPSLRRDDEAILCRSFFSTEFILRLSNGTGLAYSQIQNIHKLLLLDDNGVYMWAKVENLLTAEEIEAREQAKKDKEAKEKPEKEKKSVEKKSEEKKSEEKNLDEDKAEDKSEEKEEKDDKGEKEEKEEVVFPFDEKIYLMNLKSFSNFLESDYSADQADQANI